MIEENPDYLASKITTKENRISKLKEIENWKELGLNQKSFVRIGIPERLERNQLINKITVIPDAQFIEFYKEIISLFNVDIMQSILSSNMVCQ